MKDIETLRDIIAGAVKAYGEGSDRSTQSALGIMGPSDLGWCQNKAVLMTKGVEQTDSVSIAAAQMGIAVHHYLADALKAMFPTWIVDEKRVTATFPSGAQVSGTPDVIAPDWNALIDHKTVDGFQWVKREGTSRNHRWQRHTYAMGAIQEGLLDASKPVYVGCMYWDRSGKETEPYFTFEEFDPSLTSEINEWIDGVTYAVLHGEDGMRDIPAPICEKVCGFFTVCRGTLPINEGGEMIDDPDRIAAVRMFDEGRALAKEGEQMKKEAGVVLADSNGTAIVDGVPFTVRTTHVNATEVAAFSKAAYSRLDIRRAKGY